ncbi:MAG: glycosyltransferase [Candidatus Melainabacteria bacterium]|nr:glycosyltransferase [Candidatus Melainabacteria bacterium]
MPKVSIVIPTYNREHFISETIQSVLEQTYKDFEVVVVDDGSTDNTREKLEKFGNRIKSIFQKNSERAIARNNGVKNSTGEYIAFLDSDDTWEKDKLEKQVEILDNKKDIILAYCQCSRINKHGEKIKTAKRQLEGYSGEVFEKLLLRNFIASPTPIIRRKLYENTLGFETKHVPYEDWGFWLRYSLLGKFYFLPEALARYRIHPEQSVKVATAKKIEEVTTLILEDSFQLKKINAETKRKSLGLANLRFCYWYLLAYEKDKAKEKIKKALELYPQLLADPRWYGLQLLCQFPELTGKGIFNLEQYH